MKTLALLSLTLLSLGLTAGCHAQFPAVTSYSINYNATAPSNCVTADPCQIAYSYAVQSGGLCPSATATPPIYVSACTSVSQSSSCTQAGAPTGVIVCAIAQTLQGGVYSAPTTPINVTVPSVPGVPTAPAGSVTPVTIAKAAPAAPAAPAMVQGSDHGPAAPGALVAKLVPLRQDGR